MKVSTRGRYGIRAMAELALHFGEGAMSLKSIAEQQEIPEAYLEQLMGTLRKEGLVKSIRGAQGGYSLSRAPEKISVGDVLRALEGPIAPVDCVSEEDPENCVRAGSCKSRKIWLRMRDSLVAAIDNLTLLDLIQEQASEPKKGDELQ